MKGKELTIFGQLKIPIKFSINLNLKFLRLLNCLHMIFLLLYYVTHHLIKDKLISFINQTFIGENTQYLACNNVLFSLLMYTRISIYGPVKKSVMPLFIFWMTHLLDLKLNFLKANNWYSDGN